MTASGTSSIRTLAIHQLTMRWYLLLMLAMLIFTLPLLGDGSVPGLADRSIWRLHPIAVALLAWQWRIWGLIGGLVISVALVLLVEGTSLNSLFDHDVHSFEVITTIVLLNVMFSFLAGWATMRWSDSRRLLSIAEDNLRRAEAAQIALRSTEARHRALIEQVPAVIYIDAIDESSTTQYISPRVTDLTGYSPDEWLSDPDIWARLLHPDDRERVIAEHRRTNATGEPFNAEYRLVAKDGRIVWVRDEAVIISNVDGEPDRWQGVMYDITERKMADEALEEAETRFRTLVEQMPAIIYINAYTEPHDMLYISPHVESMLGYPPGSWLERPGFIYRVCHPDDREALRAENERSEAAGDQFSLEYRLIARDGRIVWVRDECILVHDEQGHPLFYQGVMLDVTDRKQVEESLRESEERFRGAFDYSTVGVMLATPDGRYLRVNRAFCEMLGYTEQELLAATFGTVTHSDDIERNESYRRQLVAGEIDHFQLEQRYIHKQGHSVWALVSVALVRNSQGDPLYVVGQAQDITVRKEFEERLTHQAFHDALTGLPNRALFMDRLEHALARIARHDEHVAVMFLDLDGFKAVNDTLGHGAGDDLLIAVGQRLRHWVRAADTVARLGGDEFTILFEDVQSGDEILRIAERIIDGLDVPVTLHGRSVWVRASVGIAFNTSSHITPGELLHNADIALYQAKTSGGGRANIYDPEANQDEIGTTELRATYAVA